MASVSLKNIYKVYPGGVTAAPVESLRGRSTRRDHRGQRDARGLGSRKNTSWVVHAILGVGAPARLERPQGTGCG